MLFIVLIICILFKCCSPEEKKEVSNTIPNQNQVSIPYTPPGSNKPRKVVVPSKELIRINPIDSTKIREVIEDPLGRSAIEDLVNIYLHDTVNIQNYIGSLHILLPDDSVSTNYFAEAYKRVQIVVEVDRKEFIKEQIKLDSLRVKFVTNEWVYANSSTSTDPDFATYENRWFYEQIGVFDAWKITRGSKDIKIAVIDDGFDLNHTELKNKFLNQWNVFDYSNNVYAKPKVQLHGTHVAGSIIAEADNRFGISGVAPGCMFIPIQISNESGIITTSSILDGIFYALKNKAQVINLSLGFSLGSKASMLSDDEQKFIQNFSFMDEEKLWDEVFEIALKEEVILVQAAGNDNVLAGIDPMKRSMNSIVVGAINEDNKKALFSNYGEKVNVYAPGTNIYSTLPNNEMGYLDGTSMASPIIAGCVALVLSNNPNLKPHEIVELFSMQNEAGVPFNIYELLTDLSI